jgi:hypothetical protein
VKQTPLDNPSDDFENDPPSDNEKDYHLMEGIWEIHQANEDADRPVDLIETYFVSPGFIVTYQYDAEYVKAESSLVVLLNTSGITA